MTMLLADLPRLVRERGLAVVQLTLAMPGVELHTKLHRSIDPLQKTFLIAATQRAAERALIEMATHLRPLLELYREAPQVEINEIADERLGTLYPLKGGPVPLTAREFTNKVIHCEGMFWSFAVPDNPTISVTYIQKANASLQHKPWSRAVIELNALSSFIFRHFHPTMWQKIDSKQCDGDL